MVTESCSIPFKFGDGEQIISKEKVRIPGCIGSKNVLIEANILDCELQLLMSKPALKKAGAILDFQNDVMIIDGEKVGLIDTNLDIMESQYVINANLFQKIKGLRNLN